MAGSAKKRKKRPHDGAALRTSRSTEDATPVRQARDTATAKSASGKKEKKRKGSETTPPTGNAKARTPPSIGSSMKFPSNRELEQCSQEAGLKKRANNKIVGYELKEREARQMVETNSNETRLEVSNGMWPWTSELGLSKDKETIFLFRNKLNHNTISPKLSNEITNNFLDNPIRADLKGKVYSKDMGSDMTCILTYNTKVSETQFWIFLQSVKINHNSFYKL
jgi:hypothetical protein